MTTYSNRNYILSSPITVDNLLLEIETTGLNINGTREFINPRILMQGLGFGFTDKEWARLGAHVDEVAALMYAIRTQAKISTEVYESEYYLFLKDEVEKAKNQFTQDNGGTRRAVVNFPSSHCFESIQAMIREGELYITVNMRSCNAHKNLMSDLFLAYKLALRMTVDMIDSIAEVSMIANIGSLHIFKEDFANVL